jgi:AraC-like DNA-binding protein
LKQSKVEPLSSFISDRKYSDNEGRRMSAVLEFTMNHFQKEITLDTISQEAAMTKNAFCKYFKKRTNKTYVTFLNELRIEEASKLLKAEKELSITQIAESCGFQNISNFNRKFRHIKGKTPRDFRKILV